MFKYDDCNNKLCFRNLQTIWAFSVGRKFFFTCDRCAIKLRNVNHSLTTEKMNQRSVEWDSMSSGITAGLKTMIRVCQGIAEADEKITAGKYQQLYWYDSQACLLRV